MGLAVRGQLIRLYRRLINGALRACLNLKYGTEPIPLSKISLWWGRTWGPDGLHPMSEQPLKGSSLTNEFLSKALKDEIFNPWSMSPMVLNILEAHIRNHRPSRVLELGSGLSTLCLARYMHEAGHGDVEPPLVVSVEQDERYATLTRQRLKDFGSDMEAEVIVAPMAPQEIEGHATRCYDLGSTALQKYRGQFDLLVIDGPSGEPGARFGTLPLARDFLTKGAWFFLDDAARDSEVGIAQAWNNMTGVNVIGLSMVGRGVLIGRVS